MQRYPCNARDFFASGNSPLLHPAASPGVVVISPPALELLCRHNINPAHVVRAHVTGCWPAVDFEEREQRLEGLRAGSRIVGVFALDPHARFNVHVVSEPARSLTLVVLPEEAEVLAGNR
ncbi:hypothetical protein [Xanthomonas euvesicatoria]|uniref:hypothetical protein n=1 Tax=Xanthomonas euvesicatoria TaxID=456327 RepID=UPI001E481EE4|nr:hypothetical protein [Xanthomonas euvesicatoria]MCC8612766.1 hypothetical protein [Xanthomonas euvesicatoria pv. euvesicatoria]